VIWAGTRTESPHAAIGLLDDIMRGSRFQTLSADFGGRSAQHAWFSFWNCFTHSGRLLLLPLHSILVVERALRLT
jgi:hypothetical protein